MYLKVNAVFSCTEVLSYNSLVLLMLYFYLAPERGPTVKVDKFKKNSAELTWEEIPLDIQHGFITNYTIFYAIGNTKKWECMLNAYVKCMRNV